jgi:hypothetical protein
MSRECRESQPMTRGERLADSRVEFFDRACRFRVMCLFFHSISQPVHSSSWREITLSFKCALSSSSKDGLVSFSEQAAISKSGPQLDQSASAHENAGGCDCKPQAGQVAEWPDRARRPAIQAAGSGPRGRIHGAFKRPEAHQAESALTALLSPPSA